MSSSFYESLRASVDASGGAKESRVQVNQRALIDKILARYASAGAVYRELLQNSNDAEADTAEIHFSTRSSPSDTQRPNTANASSASGNIVSQVLYRNNGIPFRDQDWDRLKNIAEGNPNPDKIGAFGVGAYTMFSICEEPLVVSGTQALCFFWKGDALWTRTADAPSSGRTGPSDANVWTSFVLPSRDPYPLPNMEEFGEFLCASLTFTKHLKLIRVLVDDQERLSIVKTLVQEPRTISTPNSSSSMMSSWFRRNEAVTSTGIFTLAPNSIMEFVYRVTVTHSGAGDVSSTSSSLDARYISASAKTNIRADMARRMERVTKKQPPASLSVQLFLNAETSSLTANSRRSASIAERITRSFCPQPGKGRIFIGFRTSQTTGLGAHVAAPFVPTVEREAMDLQDGTLRIFNTELLEFAGMLLRYTLEDTMFIMIDSVWQQNKAERLAKQTELEQQLLKGGKISTPVRSSENTDGKGKNDEDQEDDESNADSRSSSGLMGFAKFMARGVKKKIVSVVSTVEEFIDDGAEYLNPIDLMPLSEEETQAVVLMRSFCPEQSTPDATVGMCIAEGFSKCVSGAPPVLTKTGVIKGDAARLPSKGIESFVDEGVVRRIVYSNAEEYHSVIATVRKLQLDDLLHSLYSTTFELDKLIFFLKWWTKYYRSDPHGAQKYGLVVKDAVKFYPRPTVEGQSEREIVRLKDVLFYVDKSSPIAKTHLPLPESVVPPALSDAVGLSVLTDHSMRDWFSPLPTEVWASFAAQLPSMTDGELVGKQQRLDILAILCREYSSRSFAEKATFGSFLASLLGNKKCIDFDETKGSQLTGVAIPSDLYVYSAELEAFEAVGTFHKASQKLKDAAVNEDFLLAIGVRKSVSIEFLFASLNSLQWSSDPKPLVEYLRSATLTQKDIHKLQQTRYLPAETGGTENFAPSELYLPRAALRLFPFVRILQWPSEQELSERSENGAFLLKLGINTLPLLAAVLSYAASELHDREIRLQILDFLADRLGPHGLYYEQYVRMDAKTRQKFRFLPGIEKDPFGVDTNDVRGLFSPSNCYSSPACGDMGFPVLDPALGERAHLYASLFQCPSEPEAKVLLERFSSLVDSAQQKLKEVRNDEALHSSVSEAVSRSVQLWLNYLSHRSSDFRRSSLDFVRKKAVIPCIVSGVIEWFRADQVFFRKENGHGDAITEELFQIVDFNSFLAALGVKQEASTTELFQLIISDPQHVLDKLGSEQKYRSLLRRIAVNPPFTSVTPIIRNTAFLLGYFPKRSDDSSVEGDFIHTLLKAEDIYIIDNTFFARMFPVARAPPETDLEDFYYQLGSKYISTAVERRFEIVGRPSKDTELSNALKERILARGPLLVSPNITSRPLVDRAESILNEKRFDVFQAASLMAVYALKGTVRRQATTCFSRPSSTLGIQGNAVYVIEDFDWFDVGYAIGDLILKRCQLEDAFFISSLLEAPIEQLRARGFPVERILKSEPAEPIPEPQSQTTFPSQPEEMAPTPTIAAIPPILASDANQSVSKSNNSQPVPPNLSATTLESSKGDQSESFQDLLTGMFPGIDKDYIYNKLGPNPTMEQVQSVAEELSLGNYPKTRKGDFAENETASTVSNLAQDDLNDPGPRKSGLRKKLGRAFNGLRPSSIGGLQLPQPAGNRIPKGGQVVSGDSISAPTSNLGLHQEIQKPVPPVVDVNSHDNLGTMLQSAIKSSSHVSKSGIHSHTQQLTSIPTDLDRGETCEMLPGHSLKPFAGKHGNGATSNGILLFSARETPESEIFLSAHEAVIESFALVLERLCGVYGLPIASVAIFHEPNGGTIAFNANKAVHCNLRFFFSLFYTKGQQGSSECYSYWFVTLAHELAHHFVSAHNKEHGFYTESFVSMYLPKLVALLASL